MKKYVWASILVLCLTLVGCKVDLYSGLSEEDANQMLALLMLKHIDADKTQVKGGSVLIRVDRNDFVNAVEILRQNGLPKSKRINIADIFPSGQLVSSPQQEQAKLTFLKEQQLEKMLSSMDGVISAQVSIAETPAQEGLDTPPPSAAVLIKYNPDVNLATREAEIRNLIHDGIPSLRPANISVVIEAASYRYQFQAASKVVAEAPPSPWRIWLAAHREKVLVTSLGTLVFGMMGLALLKLRKNKTKKSSTRV